MTFMQCSCISKLYCLAGTARFYLIIVPIVLDSDIIIGYWGHWLQGWHAAPLSRALYRGRASFILWYHTFWLERRSFQHFNIRQYLMPHQTWSNQIYVWVTSFDRTSHWSHCMDNGVILASLLQEFCWLCDEALDDVNECKWHHTCRLNLI